MRLCIVSPYDPAPPTPQEARRATVGGVERVLQRMAHEVAARGHDVTLLCSSAAVRSATWERDVRVVRVPRRGSLLRAPIAGLHRHLPPEADVVHVPATYPFTTPAVLRAARARGQGTLLDFHFEPDPGTTVGRAAARAYRAFGPRAYALADAVAVRSKEYARLAPSLRGVPENRWRVVPNGVDAQRFTPRGSAREGGYLLVVGRLVPYKGVEVLLRALALMRDPPPLVVAGDGPLRLSLAARAAQLGVEAEFLGRVPDEDLPGLYRGARLTVLPSTNRQEAFGLCLLESLACGTPVVASDLPGVAAVARLGGLLAPPGDPAGLATVLQRASITPLPRGDLLAERVAWTYSWPAVAARLLDVYAEILGQPPARAPRPEVRDPAHPRRDAVL